MDSKRIGRLGENLVQKFLRDLGFGVGKGFGSSPDLKIYRSEIARKTHTNLGYITCEVKTTESQEYVHRPGDKQRERNDLLCLVKVLENKPLGGVRARLQFRVLGDIGKIYKESLPIDRWKEIKYD